MGLFPIQFLVKISQLNNKKLCYLTFLCNYLFLYIWKHIYFPVHLFVGWLCNSKGKNDLSVVMIPWSLKRQLPVLWQASMENNFHAIFLASPERLRTDSILYTYRKNSRFSYLYAYIYVQLFWVLFVYKYVWKKQNLHLYEVYSSQNRNRIFLFFSEESQ